MQRTDPAIAHLPLRLRAMITAMVAILVVAVLWASPAWGQSGTEFPGLEAGQRVYDQTSGSLTPPQVADLQERLEGLSAAGSDGVVFVRALDASPEETLQQVEALQQAWVARTGADETTAAAVLINRNPDDPEDARAGVFVGRTLREGNVPEDEQRAIVDDELIPPLRDGDVHASLAAGVDRLTTSVREGPPVNAFEEWAAGAVAWLPWAAFALALLLLAASLALFRRRQTLDQPDQPATTTRPGQLSPALAAGLVGGGPQASAIPATLLDLATRGAVAIEPEKQSGLFSESTIQVRLLDGSAARDEAEHMLWAALQERAEGDLVSSKALQKVAGSPAPVTDAVKAQMQARGWLDPGAEGPRAGLIVIGVLAVLLATVAFVITAVGGAPWPAFAGALALALVAVVCAVCFSVYSRLSRAGQEAAVPWRAYRQGLEQAAKDQTVSLDLDTVLPDIAAFNLGSALDDRVKAASESGRSLQAFTSTTQSADVSPAMYVAIWAGFQSSTAASTGGAGATVSGAGAGGGGGAAGST